MEKILFIQTGGTIDKDYPKSIGGYAFEITTPAVERILLNKNLNFEYEIVSLFKKDSLDITQEDRKSLLQFIQKSEYSKIIITHGTSTMLDTAVFLKDLNQTKTIILTGSFLPERFIDSDASFNVGLAIGSIEFLSNDIYIAMNGSVFNYQNCIQNQGTIYFKKV